VCARGDLPERSAISRGRRRRSNRLVDNPDLKRSIGGKLDGLPQYAEQAKQQQMRQQRKDKKVADLRMRRREHSQPAIVNPDSQHWPLQ